MTIIEVLVMFLVIIGIVGAGWLIIAGVTGLYYLVWGYFKRKKIPTKIKQEVENERLKREAAREDFRRQFAGPGNSAAEGTLEPAGTGTDTGKSEELQQVPDSCERDNTTRDPKPEVRRKSDWRSSIKSRRS